ncbi:MAG: hypothetical protein ACR2QT_14640 [Woeseiaceae bacterium]
MADAGELLRNAQYAFQNITHGDSRDNRRHTAQAKSLARKIIRRFPASSEAGEAQLILERLDPSLATHSVQTDIKHPFDPADQHDSVHQISIRQAGEQERAEPVDRDWKNLLLKLIKIRRFERYVLLVGAFFLVTLLPFAAVVIVAMIVFFAGPFEKYHPQGTQQALDNAYVQLDAWLSERQTK